MIGIGGWLYLKICWVHTQVTKNFFFSSFGYWRQNMDLSLGPLSKLEFRQWKVVDCPTFTYICNSKAINWLDCGSSFSGIQTNCLWQTICILERQLLVSITQNQHSSYPMSSSRKKHWRKLSLRSLTYSWQCANAQVIGCSASCLRLWICSTEPSCLQSRLGSQWLFPNKKSAVPSSWNLVYRWWIPEDRCRGMVYEPKQKILFSRHKQLRTKVENMHWCCMRICQKMTACVI